MSDNIIKPGFGTIKGADTKDTDEPTEHKYQVNFKRDGLEQREPAVFTGFLTVFGGCVAILKGKGDFQFLATWDQVESVEIV